MSVRDLKEKGKSIKDLPDIALIDGHNECDFSFQPIYELGRFVSEGVKDFNMEELNNIKCSHELKENVIRFFETLSEKILFEQLHFPTIVIDFVVFDPEDKKGERFHIAICSTSADIYQTYRSEVEINISGNKQVLEDKPQERGPILTNNNIYKSPYYYRGPKERELKNPVYFHRIKRYTIFENSPDSNVRQDRMKIFFGSFKVNRKNKVEINIQKAHIELFFDKIEKELLLGKGLIKNKGAEIIENKFEFNTSLLIPLLRPAASFVGDKDFRLRGGGLFLYGNTPASANLVEIAAQLQHFFYRNILNESHTQIVFDYLRHEGANHHIHDFRTFLTSELLNNIRHVIERNNLTKTDKTALVDVINKVELFQKYLTKILEAYRDFIKNSSVKLNYTSKDLDQLLYRLNNEFHDELKANFIDEFQNLNCSIKADEIVMEKIFRNLYNNSITEYQKLNIPFSEREVKVRWYIEKATGTQPDVIVIEYYNKGLHLNNVLIKIYGITPIEGDSTGLGAYFINNTLGWMLAEENKFPDEMNTNVKRYIKSENENGGCKFSFKFKLYNR